MAADLPSRLHTATSRWHLTLGAELSGGTSSAVYEARDEAGRDLVLKFPETRAAGRDATADEAAALTTWASTGATVGLVDASEVALLLVRARPGTLMPWRPSLPLSRVIDIAGELLERLWAAPVDGYPYPTLGEVYREDERVAREDADYEQRTRGEPERGRPGLQRLPSARAAAEALIRTAGEPRLVHGDFISKNLVADASSPVGWLALDPLPLIGEPATDVAAFAAYQPAELILPIAEALAACVNVNPRRALMWTAIKTVHQAAQAWRDDQEELEQLVQSKAISGLLGTTHA